MSLSKLFFALGLLSAAHTVFADQSQKGSWSFLAPGTTHSGESPLSPGKGWLALRKGIGGWELISTDIKAKKTNSEITEYDIEIKSSHKDAIAMFKLPQLTSGSVVTPILPDGLLTTFFIKENETYPSFKVQFNSDEYQFKGAKENGSYVYNNATHTYSYDAAVVEMGNKRSAIGDTGGGSSQSDSDNNNVQIVWIGDLDRDGKLDVITRVNGTNTSGLCLYLSSSAMGKELFGKPICHKGSGC